MFRLLSTSFRSLAFSPMRTSLSVVAIGVGAAVVVVMVGVGRGAERDVAEKIERMGTNLVIVGPARSSRVAGRARQAVAASTLVPRDERTLREGCPHAVDAAPAQSRTLSARFADKARSTSVVGTSARMPVVRDLALENGRFFTEAEDRGALRVAVVGRTVVRNVYPEGADPVGTMLRLGGVSFQVVGVLAPRGASLSGDDEDNQVYIPLRTALTRLFHVDYLGQIVLRARSEGDVERLAAEAEAVLRVAHRIGPEAKPDFEVRTQDELVAARREIAERFRILVTAVGSIALLVGGLGVLSVMLLGIRERTREIGLRRAVGATRRDVALQFLFESILLGVFGAAVGLVLSVAASTVAADVVRTPFVFAADALLAASGICVALGLLSGVAPAFRAASLEPVDALRK
ncbi:MAG: ABC transporter permease [Deltaproteobacteria bacterium]|nr:ABC transporter permease [Deltaproteobacteria bacterium]